jgi:hypothetical protein
MKTIVGLYDDTATARQVVEELVRMGFDRANISLVANNSTAGMDDATYSETNGDSAVEGAVSGAVAGGALGGLGGVLLGLGALAIPGIGPVVAAGPIVAGLTGAGIGAAVGGLAGALIGWGVPQEEAEYYVEGVRRGGTLVGVEADESQVSEARRIMDRYGPVNVRERSATWRSEGWTGTSAATTGMGTASTDWQTRTAATTMGISDIDTRYRTHFDQTYGSRGYAFGRYQPAYQYGYGLASEPRFAGREWSTIEMDVRRDWESRNAGPWEEFKDAVRYGWESVKDAVR